MKVEPNVIYWVYEKDGTAARRIDSEDIEIQYNAGRKIIKMYLDGKYTTEELEPNRKGGIPEGFIEESRSGAFMVLVNEEEEKRKETAQQIEQQLKEIEEVRKEIETLKGGK